MDEFETYNVDEIENVINDDDIAEANPLPDENNDVQMNESSDNNHGMSRAKKKYTFEKEVNEKLLVLNIHLIQLIQEKQSEC